MNVQPIHDLDDPRSRSIAISRITELERRGQHFIAEGEHIVRRLLASDFPVESVLLADRRAENGAARAGGRARFTSSRRS